MNIPSAKWLLSHDITSVIGTLQSNGRGIPIKLKKAAERELYSHLRFWEEEQKTDSSFLSGKSKKYWTEKSSAYANSSNNTRDYER